LQRAQNGRITGPSIFAKESDSTLVLEHYSKRATGLSLRSARNQYCSDSDAWFCPMIVCCYPACGTAPTNYNKYSARSEISMPREQPLTGRTLKEVNSG